MEGIVLITKQCTSSVLFVTFHFVSYYEIAIEMLLKCNASKFLCSAGKRS